jgi:hypothetical protein
MNVVNDRKDLVRFARRARARRGLVRAVEVSLRALFYALCASFLALLAAKLLSLSIPVPESAVGLAALVLLSGLIAAFVPRLDLLESAAAVDERAGWKERLSSALAIPVLQHPMEAALVEDVRERLRDQKPSRLFPLRAPRELRFAPLPALAIAAVAFLVPPQDLLGLAAREKEKVREKKEIAAAVEKLEARKKALEKSDRPMEKAKEALKKIEALAAEFQKNPPADRKEAVAEISKLSDEIKKMKEELSKSGALAERMQKAAAEKGGDTGELGKMIREGNFSKAVQELAKMRNALQEGKLSKEEREKLQRQMEALAEKMSKDKELSEMEKKLAKAIQGLKDGDEKGLEDLQKQLSQLEGDQAESEQLAESLKDLENLSDALAKGEGECPVCGKKKGKGEGKCEGHGDGEGDGLGLSESPWKEGDTDKEGAKGLGPGKGFGERPETPADFETEKSKVPSKLGKGTYVGAYFMKGEPPKGQAAAQYADVQRAAAEEAMDALQKQKVPVAQRDYVRDYFDAIRLEKK